MEFEWDLKKEEENIKKHGVFFSEAVDSFSDPNVLRLVDARRSENEERYYWLGQTKSGRVLTTWYTYRGAKIRIIGSGEWRKGRRLYHERAKLEGPED